MTDQMTDVDTAPIASNKRGRRSANSLMLGAVLIVVGIALLAGRLLGFSAGRYLWPLYILGPGVLLFLFSLTAGTSGEGLAIAGGIVTMVGALLFYQNLTGHWQSWAYAWALIAPTSVGLAQILYGALKDQEHIVKTGNRLVKVGIVIFLVGAVFFELVIGISGLGTIGWPVVLIVVGIIFLVRTLMRR